MRLVRWVSSVLSRGPAHLHHVFWRDKSQMEGSSGPPCKRCCHNLTNQHQDPSAAQPTQASGSFLHGIPRTDFNATAATHLGSGCLRNTHFSLEIQQSRFQKHNSYWSHFDLNKRRLLTLCSLRRKLELALLAKPPRAWICQSFRHVLHFFTLMWIMRSFSNGWTHARGKEVEIRGPELV